MDAERSSESKIALKWAAPALGPDFCCHSSPSSTASDSSSPFTSDSSNSISAISSVLLRFPDLTSAVPPFSSFCDRETTKQPESLAQGFGDLLMSSATATARFEHPHRRDRSSNKHGCGHHLKPVGVSIPVDEDSRVRHSDTSVDSGAWRSTQRPPASGSPPRSDVSQFNALLASHRSFCYTTTNAHQIINDSLPRKKTSGRDSNEAAEFSRSSISGRESVGSRVSNEVNFCSRNGRTQDPASTSDSECEQRSYTNPRRSLAAKNRVHHDGGKPCTPRTSHFTPAKDMSSSPFAQGSLRIAEQDGYPCYSFSVNCIREEVLFCRIKRSGKNENKVYTFHSKTVERGWTTEISVPNMVAKMRVYENVQVQPSPQGHFLLDGHHQAKYATETHFVLYRKKLRRSLDHQLQNDQILPSESLPPRMAMVHLPHRQKHRRLHIHGIGNQVVSASDSSSNNMKSFKVPRTKRVELAAIVVCTSLQGEQGDNMSTGDAEGEKETLYRKGFGWGVKFLEKRSGQGWGMRFLDRASKLHHLDDCISEACRIEGEGNCYKILHREEERNCKICRGSYSSVQSAYRKDLCRSCARSPKQGGSHLDGNPDRDGKPRSSNRMHWADVAVILPAGNHGLPRDHGDGDDYAQNGPTPLLERWKSGGSCECGGWDMGCGLSVLKSPTLTLPKTLQTVAAPNQDLAWLPPGRPLYISMQGYRQSTVLTLESIEVGHISLSFQGPFSPLQAFATAVAILHRQQIS